MAVYTGVSIVDYLKSVGQPSDYTSRAILAQQKGITNYTGTGAQNTQLLNMLRTPTSAPAPVYTPPAPAPQQPTYTPPQQTYTQPAPTQQSNIQQPTQQVSQYNAFYDTALRNKAQIDKGLFPSVSINLGGNQEEISAYKTAGFTISGNQAIYGKTPTPTAPTTTPIISTSEPARTTFDTNVNTVLPKMEAGLAGSSSQYTGVSIVDYLKSVGQPSDINSRIALGKQYGIDYSKSTTDYAAENTQLLAKLKGSAPQAGVSQQEVAPSQAEAPLTYKSDNPALQALIDQANKLITDAQTGGIVLDSETQQKINEINNFQDQKTSAIADARTAADDKDAAKTNEAITKAKEADASMKTAFDALMVDLKAKQAEYITSLKPSDRETQLRTDIQKLRTGRQLEPLELRAEGISAAGIGGRQIDNERVRAIQEGNLLFELGLEQEARQFKTATLSQQMSFLTGNFELQMKVQDKIGAKEKDVLAEARNLRKDSLSALSSILDDQKGFGGLDWQDIGQDPQAQADLMNLIKPYPDLSVSLVSKALSNVKQQMIFKNALAKAKAKAAGKPTADDEKPMTMWEISTFAKSYGWTPPFGFTKSQLTQFTNDNPTATPEQLEAGAKQAMAQTQGIKPEERYLSEDYFRTNFTKDELKKLSDKAGTSSFWTPASMDINRFLKETMKKVEEARLTGYSDKDIEKFLTK